MANKKNTKEDFWKFVNIRLETSCWEWVGSLWATGYGRFNFDNKSHKAHRLAWKFVGYELLDDDCLLHKCDNRLCVNPSHLMIGSRAENNADKTIKGRQTKGTKVYTAKITENDVIAIRNSKESSKELAEKYNLTWGNVNKIRSGRTWNHVQ